MTPKSPETQESNRGRSAGIATAVAGVAGFVGSALVVEAVREDATTPILAGLLLLGVAVGALLTAVGVGRSPWRRAFAALPLMFAPLLLVFGAVFVRSGPSADSGSWTVVAYGWALVGLGMAVLSFAVVILIGGGRHIRWCMLAVVVGGASFLVAGAFDEFVPMVASAVTMAVAGTTCAVLAAVAHLRATEDRPVSFTSVDDMPARDLARTWRWWAAMALYAAGVSAAALAIGLLATWWWDLRGEGTLFAGLAAFGAAIALVIGGSNVRDPSRHGVLAFLPIAYGWWPMVLGGLLGLIGRAPDSGSWEPAILGWTIFGFGASFMLLGVLVVRGRQIAVVASCAITVGLCVWTGSLVADSIAVSVAGSALASVVTVWCAAYIAALDERPATVVAALIPGVMFAVVAYWFVQDQPVALAVVIAGGLAAVRSRHLMVAAYRGGTAGIRAPHRPAPRVRACSAATLLVEAAAVGGYAMVAITGELGIGQWPWSGIGAAVLASALACGAFLYYRPATRLTYISRAAAFAGVCIVVLALAEDTRFPLGEAVGVLGAALAAYALAFAYPRRRVFLPALEVLAILLLVLVLATEVPGLGMAYVLGAVAMALEARQYLRAKTLTAAAI